MTLDRGRKNTQLLIQPQYSPMAVGEQIAILYCGTRGLMHDVPVEQIRECQTLFLNKLHSTHQSTIDFLASGELNDEACSVLESVMADIAGQFQQV